MEIWINPACSKCRTAVTELDAAGLGYSTRRYLEQPPTAAEIEDVLGRLALEPWEITRTKDADQATGESLDALPKDAAHRPDWVALLAAQPHLIQRPIITLDDGTAVIGRDPDTLAQVVRRSAPATD